MFGFLNKNKGNEENKMVMLTESDVQRLKKNHGVVLFFMNGCGHCTDMKDEWNAAVDECRNNGIGHSNDDFVLGAIENGSKDMFQKHGITTNVSGYPTILYISSENIRQGNTNHEKYENPRKKDEFISWIKDKKNRKKSKTQAVKTNNIGKQIGGGRSRSRSRSNRRKQTRKSKSKRYMKRHTRKHKRTRRQHRHPNTLGGGSGCGCGSGSGGFGSLFK
jgi:hypothetical protein